MPEASASDSPVDESTPSDTPANGDARPGRSPRRIHRALDADEDRLSAPRASSDEAAPEDAHAASDRAPGGDGHSASDRPSTTDGVAPESRGDGQGGDPANPEPSLAVHAASDAPPADAEDTAEDIAEGSDAAAAPREGVDEAAIQKLDVKDRVVTLLLRQGVVTVEHVQQAKRRKTEGHRSDALWRVVAEGADVPRADVYETAARIYAFPIADIDAHPPNPDQTRSLFNGMSEAHQDELLELRVVPLRVRRGRNGTILDLITHDQMRPAVHRAVRKLEIDRFELKYAPESSVQRLISEAYPQKNEYLERIEEEDSVDLGQSYQEDEDDGLVNQEQLEAEINRSTLINLFEATLVEAVREGASDIHIFPNPKEEIEIHFRIDGRLEHWHTEHRVHPEALLSVIKDNSMNVDRFERESAQDGFIQRWVDDTRIRYRVSIMPVASAGQEIDAESIVIRVLDDRKVITNLDKLGLGQVALDRFEHAINQPHGMVILTGPTGSGKSTTLVAALHRVIGPEENVLTIEDPVEYIIEGARQIKLSHKLHLEDALRSVLRHDPDTVMVGEMRDRETAELAIKLANTGHLTFSTLHTNDAPSAISRLYKMGIEPFLIAYAINLVVAQRLIRNLCPQCKEVDPNPDTVLLEQLGFASDEIETIDVYTEGHDRSCSRCSGTGYKGRQAIAEALYFSRPIRHMIVEADDMVDEGAIRDHAEQEDGMLSLQASAREVVRRGETSIREMMRVVASEGS